MVSVTSLLILKFIDFMSVIFGRGLAYRDTGEFSLHVLLNNTFFDETIEVKLWKMMLSMNRAFFKRLTLEVSTPLLDIYKSNGKSNI